MALSEKKIAYQCERVVGGSSHLHLVLESVSPVCQKLPQLLKSPAGLRAYKYLQGGTRIIRPLRILMRNLFPQLCKNVTYFTCSKGSHTTNTVPVCQSTLIEKAFSTKCHSVVSHQSIFALCFRGLTPQKIYSPQNHTILFSSKCLDEALCDPVTVRGPCHHACCGTDSPEQYRAPIGLG